MIKMVFEITIGKMVYTPNQYKQMTNETFDSERTFPVVVEMPKLRFNIFDKEIVYRPLVSKRYGLYDLIFYSFKGMFYNELPELNKKYFYVLEGSVKIGDNLNTILELDESKLDQIDKNRMTWLKFWCERAVNEYGDKAGIMFN